MLDLANLNLPGEPFDLVLDVGGNTGGFAAQAVARWPSARVVSFEPVPTLGGVNRTAARRRPGHVDALAGERWEHVEVAISDRKGEATLYVCQNQHTVSTMMEVGGTRAREFGVRDSFAPIRVTTLPLDAFLPLCEGRERILVKVDVEGHEAQVLAGASRVLNLATTVVVECQQDRDIFIDAPTPDEVDDQLQVQGLAFCGIADVLLSPSGRVLQFDGIWSRADASL